MGVAARRLSEVMETEIVTLRETDRLDLADDIMRLGRIRHIPVLDAEGRLVGMVSNRDLLAASLSKTLDFDPLQRRTFMRSVDVSEVMTREVFQLSRDATLREAAELMVRHRIGSVAVTVADGTLVGLVTETDLIRASLLEDDAETGAKREEVVMPELGERIEKELGELRRMRDELKVQIHLARAEAKERWDELEGKFRELEGKARQLARASEAPLHDIGEAVKLLLAEIREGYRRIRSAL
jgi:CBS domain-containing protein